MQKGRWISLHVSKRESMDIPINMQFKERSDQVEMIMEKFESLKTGNKRVGVIQRARENSKSSNFSRGQKKRLKKTSAKNDSTIKEISR